MSSTLSTSQADKISAYYCLLFPNFAYYLQTLSVSIGRRPTIRSGASASSSDPRELVDIDLGPLSQVSRLHARIDYDDDQELFVLVILGRNGAWVDGVWYASGRKVPLGARTQITIANQTFHFLLPSTPDTDDSQSISSQQSSRERSPSVDIMSMSPTTAPRSISSGPSDDEQGDYENAEVCKRRVSKKRKKTTVSPPKRAKGKGEAKKIPPDEMPPKPAITYANLSYRAITAQGGRASLQEVCRWIVANFDWYRLNEGMGWESSVRHTLSSNKAFTKVKRKPTDRGKGYLWTVNKLYASTFEGQDTGATTFKIRATREGGKSTTSGKVTEEPEKPLGSAKGSLPTPAATPSRSTPVPEPSSSTQTHLIGSSSTQQPKGTTPPTQTESSKATSTTIAPAAEIPASLIIPIVVKELPPEHPALLASPAINGAAATILKHQPIIHDKAANILVLSPVVFGTLTQSVITDLQNLGARKALDTLRERYTQFLKERLAAGAGGGSKKKKNKHKDRDKTKHHDSDSPVVKQESGKTTITGSSVVESDEPAMKKRKLDNDVGSR